MLKAFKYRLYPSADQEVLLNKHIWSCRLVYNLALEVKQAAWYSCGVRLSGFDLIKQLPDLKKECPWLTEVNSQSLQQSIISLDRAFKRFFEGHSGFPKFKKKSEIGSFSVQQRIFIKGDKLLLFKFKGGISIRICRPIQGKIRSATITRTSTGKYFVSILCETGEPVKPKSPISESTTVGLDVGLKSFLVTSEGREFDNPKYHRKHIEKIRFLGRKYSIHKGKRTKRKLAVLHEKIANQRKDFLHKLSSELINNHDSLAIETLKIANLLRNKSLSFSIADASWREFFSMLEYKADWRGKNIIKIGTFEPSSKLCSGCGSINALLTLRKREWTCSVCGSVLNRDINAAINIRNIALKMVQGTGTKNQNELPALVGVLTSETASY